MAIKKFPKNNKWNLEEILCAYKNKIDEIIDIINTGGDVSPELIAEIKNIKDKLNALTVEVATNTRNIKETNLRVLTNITNIENLQCEVEELKKLIGVGHEDIIEVVEALSKRLNDLASSLTAKVEENTDDIDAIKESIITITNDIINMKSSITSITSDIELLKAKHIVYDKDITDLKEKLKGLETQIEPVLKLFTEIEVKFNEINNKFNLINEKLNELDTNIANNKSKIITMDSTLTNHESRISAIEGAGGGTEIQVIDSLESTSTTFPLSANQGRVLKGLIDDIQIPDITAIKNITIDTNGDLMLVMQDDSIVKVPNKYFINAELLDVDGVKKLKFVSSECETIIELPCCETDNRAVIGIDANTDGTISYGHLDGQVTSKDTPYVWNIIQENDNLIFKRNTGDIIIPTSSTGGVNAIVGAKEDTLNDGIGFTYADGKYDRVPVRNTPTVAKSIKLWNVDTKGKVTLSLNNGNTTVKETPFVYDITLDEEVGLVEVYKGNNTVKEIDLRSYVITLINEIIPPIYSIKTNNKDHFVNYFKIEDGKKIDITKEEYYNTENTDRYFKLVDGELIEVTKDIFDKI